MSEITKTAEWFSVDKYCFVDYGSTGNFVKGEILKINGDQFIIHSEAIDELDWVDVSQIKPYVSPASKLKLDYQRLSESFKDHILDFDFTCNQDDIEMIVGWHLSLLEPPKEPSNG